MANRLGFLASSRYPISFLSVVLIVIRCFVCGLFDKFGVLIFRVWRDSKSVERVFITCVLFRNTRTFLLEFLYLEVLEGVHFSSFSADMERFQGCLLYHIRVCCLVCEVRMLT